MSANMKSETKSFNDGMKNTRDDRSIIRDHRDEKQRERSDPIGESNYVRLRGLPFSAKEDDVRKFLQDVNTRSVTFTLTPTGRASGECYVELENKDDVSEALKLHKNEMNGRYIEVFTVSNGEVIQMIRHGVLRSPDGRNSDRLSRNYVVRLRGIPFSATVEDIRAFFSGLDVADVVIDKEPGGRPSGEAFVRLSSKQHAEEALERNRNNMGTRYVEVFRSSGEEMENSYHAARGFPPPVGDPMPLRYMSSRSDPYDDRYLYGGRLAGPMRGGPDRRPRPSPYDLPYERYGRYDPDFDERDYHPQTKVFMRGLPYNVTALDIEDFFKPMMCVEIKLGYNADRRPSGDGIVIFPTAADARDALLRNKQCIGTRYIELFTIDNMPPQRRFETYRTIGGVGPLGPRPSSRSRFDDGYGYGSSYGSGGQQFYNDQYEGRQIGFDRHWSSARPSW
ncbi:hypothetical protein AB6A40_002255 [Gnathostoma spinigerum]|uniref:RRM domain-containing protein n=1 Tax=Gnathostoma spinigerum TaxID=75299 RepID=A0ABD6E7F3_9BILA